MPSKDTPKDLPPFDLVQLIEVQLQEGLGVPNGSVWRRSVGLRFRWPARLELGRGVLPLQRCEPGAELGSRGHQRQRRRRWCGGGTRGKSGTCVRHALAAAIKDQVEDVVIKALGADAKLKKAAKDAPDLEQMLIVAALMQKVAHAGGSSKRSTWATLRGGGTRWAYAWRRTAP